MQESQSVAVKFSDLNLPDTLNRALEDVGYETPTPIQSQAIPHLLDGHDVLGRAPTGTGKTAAFALPLLARTNVKSKHVQTLILTPTRELAIQVSEALQQYARHLEGFHVLPVYGGQAYAGQIRQLRRGVQAVVGTPGRVMDHIRKGNLSLKSLKALVLDEADEMLKMGFIDDVKWILEQTPDTRQMALFSATMPKEIQLIAERHMQQPKEVSIQNRAQPAATINQRHRIVSYKHKLDVLTRILEAEDFDAVLIFVRTKVETSRLAERLEARGYAAVALNGDMPQKNRERVVNRLKKGSIDIVVATDVAARGLDVDRISHVINYDIPHDSEAYVHRIGRTGRAGRKGKAILFVTPREKRMLHAIQKATRQKIPELELPTTEMVQNRRIAVFMQDISDTIAAGDLDFMRGLVEKYCREHDVPAVDVAAALAKISVANRKAASGSLHRRADQLRTASRERKKPESFEVQNHSRTRQHLEASAPEKRKSSSKERQANSNREPQGPDSVMSKPARGMERFRLHVGAKHDVKPKNIVGAIANEAGLESEYIGPIVIWDDLSFVDLPRGMPDQVFRHLGKVWVCGQQLRIERLEKPRKQHGRTSSARHQMGTKGRRGQKKATKGKAKGSRKNRRRK